MSCLWRRSADYPSFPKGSSFRESICLCKNIRHELCILRLIYLANSYSFTMIVIFNKRR